MTTIFQQMIQHMASNPKKMFLIDGLGAIFSIFLLGFVLVQLEPFLGMPKRILYLLALIPSVFAVYSFFCAFKIKRQWRIYLKIIAAANFSYCCVTILEIITN